MTENSAASLADSTASKESQITKPSPASPSDHKNVWRSYAIFSICATLYILPFMHFGFLHSDEGILLGGAERIVHGQVLARDFFQGLVGTPYCVAAFFKLFGVSFASARIFLFVSSFGTALSMYFLARRLSPRFAAMAPLVLVASLFPFWPEVTYHVDSDLAALISVIWMALWCTKQRPIYLVTAGAFAGFATCVLYTKGALFVCAILGWLWLRRKRLRAPYRSILMFTAGYSIVLLLVLWYFWSRHALGNLFYANVVFPYRHYMAVNHVRYGQGIHDLWVGWVGVGGGSIWSVGFALLLIPSPLIIAGLPLLCVLLARKYMRKPLRPEVALYAAAGAAIWLGESQRPALDHLAFGSPLLLVLCFYFLVETRNRAARIAARTIWTSAICLALFNWFMVALIAHPFNTRAGTIKTSSPTSNVTFLMNHVPAGEDIFVYPYRPMYYFITATTNPTPYSFLLYGFNTRSQFQQAIDILERRKVKYVVWDTNFESKFFPAGLPKDPSGFIFERYLECRYTVAQDDHGERVMKRKTEAEIAEGRCPAAPQPGSN